MHQFLNMNQLVSGMQQFHDAKPFRHAVIDQFLSPELAKKVAAEFPAYDSARWFCYQNDIEDKKALNDWNAFPALTYALFQTLNSPAVIDQLSQIVGVQLYPDNGLHGGGWHIHGTGGNLNPHLDYSIHPKLGLQRKINLIIYVSEELKAYHGGHLGLWTHDEDGQQPGALIKEICPKFNRAVIFDTTQNAWHGMSRPLTQPYGIYRKSLAVYYLCEPPVDADPRGRALFAPRECQKDDPGIAELIRMRAQVNTSGRVYRKQPRPAPQTEQGQPTLQPMLEATRD